MDGTETARTKRALAALADGNGRSTGSYTDVVAAATTALDDTAAAASFLDADGEARLATAVVEAVRAGDDDAVRRGRHALATLRSFRESLSSNAHPRARPEAPSPSSAVHFHPAHGTVLRRAGKRGDR